MDERQKIWTTLCLWTTLCPRLPTVKYTNEVNLEYYYFYKLNILHNICLKMHNTVKIFMMNKISLQHGF